TRTSGPGHGGPMMVIILQADSASSAHPSTCLCRRDGERRRRTKHGATVKKLVACNRCFVRPPKHRGVNASVRRASSAFAEELPRERSGHGDDAAEPFEQAERCSLWRRYPGRGRHPRRPYAVLHRRGGG